MKIKAQKYYFIGLKGVGMTMLAQFLASQGHVISGSDIKDVFLTDQVLKKAKIKIFTPFSVKNIPDQVTVIVYSSAFTPANNLELAFIKNNPERFKKVKILSYAAALGEVFNQYYGLAVCGSHGKTTTTAWLGYVLWRGGLKPNVLVGSRVPQFKGSALVGGEKYLVAEVDEYQNKLQYFQPRGVILNNIEFDHPDFFKNQTSYTKVFADFLKKIPASGFLVINNHDLEIKKIRNKCRGKIITYGWWKENSRLRPADYSAAFIKQQTPGQVFQVFKNNHSLGEFKISLSGEHNILNALAVIATAEKLGLKLAVIKKYLAGFTGTARRSEILGKYRGALIIDDYAHHPTEIKTTLKGLRASYPNKKIITVFHPHTYTRTKALFKDFVSSFSLSDELVVLDIYGSAREKQGGVSSQELVRALKKYNQANKVSQSLRNIKTIPEATAYLKKKLQAGDLLLLMGAGDVFRVGQELLKK